MTELERIFHIRGAFDLTPTEPHHKNYGIRNFEHWFDAKATSMEHNSTLICKPGYVTDHGYEGVPV